MNRRISACSPRRDFRVLASRTGRAVTLPKLAVYRNPGCGCCEGWVQHMTAAGFKVTIEDDPNLEARRASLGYPPNWRVVILHSRTAMPSRAIFRCRRREVSQDRPVGAIALVVPGMPMESPGMESGGNSEAYDVLMISANAAPTVYASH